MRSLIITTALIAALVGIANGQEFDQEIDPPAVVVEPGPIIQFDHVQEFELLVPPNLWVKTPKPENPWDAKHFRGILKKGHREAPVAKKAPQRRMRYNKRLRNMIVEALVKQYGTCRLAKTRHEALVMTSYTWQEFYHGYLGRSHWEKTHNGFPEKSHITFIIRKLFAMKYGYLPYYDNLSDKGGWDWTRKKDNPYDNTKVRRVGNMVTYPHVDGAFQTQKFDKVHGVWVTRDVGSSLGQ